MTIRHLIPEDFDELEKSAVKIPQRILGFVNCNNIAIADDEFIAIFWVYMPIKTTMKSSKSKGVNGYFCCKWPNIQTPNCQKGLRAKKISLFSIQRRTTVLEVQQETHPSVHCFKTVLHKQTRKIVTFLQFNYMFSICITETINFFLDILGNF